VKVDGQGKLPRERSQRIRDLGTPDSSGRTVLPPGFQFRPATNGDGPAVRALVFATLREYGLCPDPASTDADLDGLEQHYRATGGCFDVLLEPGGQVIGSFGLLRLTAETCELRKMYLARNYRGRGLGRVLLDRALAAARVMNCRRITLQTASVLREAIALYEKTGFRPFADPHMPARCNLALELRLEKASAK
jgi:putative acetyltransferase